MWFPDRRSHWNPYLIASPTPLLLVGGREKPAKDGSGVGGEVGEVATSVAPAEVNRTGLKFLAGAWSCEDAEGDWRGWGDPEGSFSQLRVLSPCFLRYQTYPLIKHLLRHTDPGYT